jgi:hypothetical protein
MAAEVVVRVGRQEGAGVADEALLYLCKVANCQQRFVAKLLEHSLQVVIIRVTVTAHRSRTML